MPKSGSLTPRVGIFYFVGGKLWLDTTAVENAECYGDGKTHERSHVDYWDQLVRAGSVPDDEYEEHPRGRVNFSKKANRYLLLADKCIRQRAELIKQVMAEMHLPLKQTDVSGDPHYKCFRCLGQLDEVD